MDINQLMKKGQSYKEAFFWGEMTNIQKVYENELGLVVVFKNADDVYEVFWGVNNLSDLKSLLKEVNRDFNNFIFRYGSFYNHVKEVKELFVSWEYNYKNMHLGYFCDLVKREYKIDNKLFIQELKKDEINELLNLEKSIFDLFNASYEELNEWITSVEDIILTLKKAEKIIGFLIMNLYGEDKKQCLIRNLAIKQEYRGKKLGQKLLESGLQKLKENGIENVMLWVDDTNIVAIKVYEKLGFILNEKECEAVFYK